MLENGKYAQAIEVYRLAIKDFETVTGGDREIAANHRLTAVNGITVALGHLGKEDEAIALLRKELEQTEIPYFNKFSLTVSLCNRLITLHQERLKKNDKVFTEVCDLLDSLTVSGIPNHEEQGVLHCVHGALYMAIEDIAEAKRYYQQAKKEFVIVNSRHLIEVEQIITNIPC